MLKEGHFYVDPNLKDYFYYCEKIKDNIISWILLESYQHGHLIQVRFRAKSEGSIHYQEVKEQKEIMRLNNMLKEFYKMEKKNEFNKMIEKIDNNLRSKNVPIHGRPLHAIREICVQRKISLNVIPKGTAIPGNYEGDSLVAHVHQWYENKYGDRLKMNLSPGSVAVMIKGDVWKIDYPLFFGKAKFVFDPNLDKYEDEPMIQKNVPYMIFNPLKFIEGFTPDYAKTLTKTEMVELKDNLVLGLKALQLLSEIKTKPYIPEAKADLDSAVNNMFSLTPNYGQSKWASLQFTEKLFKCFLKLKNVSFPKDKKGHDLELLSNLASQNGLSAISVRFIQDIQCHAGVRYGEKSVTLKEAILAHHSSLKVCSVLAPVIKEIK